MILNSLFRGACSDTCLVVVSREGGVLACCRESKSRACFFGNVSLADQTRLLVIQHLILGMAHSGHSIIAC